MIDAIISEIELRKDFLDTKHINSIYLGGGTPSLLNEQDFALIFDAIGRFYSVTDSAEITLEANPDDLTTEKLATLKNSPINRLSIGIQSFFEEDLQWMNRAHNAKEAESCIKQAQDFGFDNLSIDLIFGIPISDHKKWQINLEKAISFDAHHISAYALTVEEGTALNHFVKVGKVIAAEDAYVMQQFDKTIEVLTSAGYEHYEISNYAKKGHHAVHNTSYWQSKPYVGIGPSAHSYDVKSRSANIANNAKYLKAIKSGQPNLEVELLDDETRYNEYVMTRLRTMWGIDINEIDDKFKSFFKERINELLIKNWVVKKNNSFVLTAEGKHFADAAAMELFSQ